MHFAVIFLPQFSLQAVLRFREELRDKPAALLDDASGKDRVLEITPAAEEVGVACGLTSPQALARCGELVLLRRSPEQEKIVTQILLELAFSLAPGVEETALGICTVDVRKAKMPDPERWAAEIVARLSSLRLEAKVGVAGTPDLALLAARTATPSLVVRDSLAFLSARPLEELSPSPELLRIFHDWGIQHFGGLTRLPAEEIAARLGVEAARLWEQAAGKSDRLLAYVRPPEIFAETFEFEHEIETVEPLLFLLRRFLDQLTLRLRAVYRVAAQMHLVLPLENGSEYARHFTIPAPTDDVEPLFRILHTHLENLHLDHRPVALRLTIQPTEGRKRQMQIFENPLRDPNRFGETLGRLAALVGSENVGVPQPGKTHRPGEFHLEPPAFGAEEEAGLLEEEAPDLGIGLPLRRYRPPLPARVETERSQPVAAAFEKVGDLVAHALGPYRISGEWWDSRAWETEEWDVEMAGGGLYRLSRKGREWFVEGCYEPAAPPVSNREPKPRDREDQAVLDLQDSQQLADGSDAIHGTEASHSLEAAE